MLSSFFQSSESSVILYHYPRRRRSTVAWILQSLRHAVYGWVGMYVSTIKPKPLIRLTWNLPISSALHYAEACWFWVRKVSGASVHISGLSLNPRWRAFMVIHAWHEVWCHPEQLCLHLHQRNRGDCRDVPRSRALRQILTTSGFITDIDWAVDMAQNRPLWSLFSAHCTVHC